jgi:hypothetical protein
MHELLHTFETVAKHPAVVALVSVALGTWLFGHMSYRRSHRDAMRQQAIEFIDQISVALNAALSSLYRGNWDRVLLPTREAGVADSMSVDSRIHDLFKLRMPMHVKSIVYLGGGDFDATYKKMISELASILTALRHGNEPRDTVEERLRAVELDASHMLVKALDTVTRSSYASFHHVRRVRERYDRQRLVIAGELDPD